MYVSICRACQQTISLGIGSSGSCGCLDASALQFVERYVTLITSDNYVVRLQSLKVSNPAGAPRVPGGCKSSAGTCEWAARSADCKAYQDIERKCQEEGPTGIAASTQEQKPLQPVVHTTHAMGGQVCCVVLCKSLWAPGWGSVIGELNTCDQMPCEVWACLPAASHTAAKGAIKH